MSGRKRYSLALLLVLTVPILGIVLGAAAAGPAGPRIVDNERGSHIALSIPGFLIRAAGRWIPDAPDEARTVLRQVRGIRIEVREGGYHPGFAADPDAFNAQAAEKAFAQALAEMERGDYEPMMLVQSADEHIAIHAVVDRKDRIRKLAILADDGESFIQMRLRTKLGAAELGELLEATGFDKDRIGLSIGTE